MRSILLTLVVVLMTSINAVAQSFNLGQNVEARQTTQVTLPIVMNNSVAVRGFQLDVEMPVGLVPTISKSGSTDHELSVSTYNANTWRVLSFSMANATYTTNYGTVANIAFTIPADFATGDYTITVKNSFLSGTANEKIEDNGCSVRLRVRPSRVPAESIELSATNIAMFIGESGRLMATVYPVDATEKEIQWSISNSDVATVSQTGVVNAVGVGEATITATCGVASASCSVTVAPRDGDVNGDGRHTVSDVTLTAGYIMETLAESNTFYKDAADIDKDGMVIVPDLTSIVDLVLDADNTPEAPQNVVATGRINTVLVTWNTVVGADSYIVYRSADGEDFDPIAFNVTEPSFVDEEPLDGTNYYKVGVVSGYAKSELSEAVNAAIVTEIPNNEIWYVTMDDEPININMCKEMFGNEPFDRKVVSHTYENGLGKILCDGIITRLNNYAFYSSGNNIVELFLPNSIEHIGYVAVNGTQLKKLHIPNSLKTVDAYCFGNNSYLSELSGKNVSDDGRCLVIDNVLYGFAPANLNDYVLPNNIHEIYCNVFSNCLNLKRLQFNEGLKYIHADAFTNCGIEYVNLPESLQDMHPYAFRECPNIKAFYGNKKFVSEDNKCLWIHYEDLYGTGEWLINFAGQDDIEYSIPDGVIGLENYSFQYASKLQRITFPECLRKIGSTAFEGLTELKEFHGAHTTEDHRAFIFDGLMSYFLDNDLTEYTIPDGVKYLGQGLFEQKQYLEVLKMTDEVESCNDYAFHYSPKLREVTISARMKYLGYDPFDCCYNLETVYLRAPIPPTLKTIYFNEFEKLTIYVPQESLDIYLSNPNWEPYHKFIKPYNYTDLPENLMPEGYISSDYSKNGEVQKLQSATVGNGIDLVFMGDGFIDKDMDEGGKYEQVMNEAMEKFFSIEPYKTLRNRFNVYSVKIVSMNDTWGDNAYHAILENDDAAFKYASAIEGIKQDHLYVNVIYNAPTDGSWYGRSYTTMYYGDGSYVSYNMEGVNNVLIHEAGGHGFAKLADEYVEFDATYNDYYGLDQMHEMNWYQNVDYRNTPEDVYWNRFMADSRYDGQVGIYEGAFTYSNGVYRPTENSMMRYNDSPFNAPSREAIYKAIMRESEGESCVYNYEDFVAYDEINRQAEAKAPRRAPSRQEIEEYEKHHKAPVIVKGGWRDAAVKTEESAPQAAKRQMPMLASGHSPLQNHSIVECKQPRTENTLTRSSYSKVNTELSVFEIAETNAEDGTAAIEVAVKTGYIATQFDVILSEGISLTKAVLVGNNTQTHKMTYRRLAEGRVRVVIFSMDNAEMTDNFVRLTLRGEGEVLLTNALVNEMQADGKIVEKAAANACATISSNATGVISVENSIPASEELYNLNGQRVSTDYKGIVIKKGAKFVSK